MIINNVSFSYPALAFVAWVVLSSVGFFAQFRVDETGVDRAHTFKTWMWLVILPLVIVFYGGLFGPSR
jgi:hypothetical protein